MAPSKIKYGLLLCLLILTARIHLASQLMKCKGMDKFSNKPVFCFFLTHLNTKTFLPSMFESECEISNIPLREINLAIEILFQLSYYLGIYTLLYLRGRVSRLNPHSWCNSMLKMDSNILKCLNVSVYHLPILLKNSGLTLESLSYYVIPCSK